MSGDRRQPAPGRPVVVVVEDNLFLRPRIESSLEAAGFAPRCLVSAERVRESLVPGVVALLVNLDSSRIDWEAVVRAARARELPVVGYGPHVEKTLFSRARDAGITEVVPNGLVAKNAAGVVGVHVPREG